MSFLSTIGKDVKGVFEWLASPKGQAVVECGCAVAEGFGAPVALVNLAEGWIHKAITTEALAIAAGSEVASSAQKAAAAINQMRPIVASYFPAATPEQMKTANDAIVAFLNAFEMPSTATKATPLCPGGSL